MLARVLRMGTRWPQNRKSAHGTLHAAHASHCSGAMPMPDLTAFNGLRHAPGEPYLANMLQVESTWLACSRWSAADMLQVDMQTL